MQAVQQFILQCFEEPLNHGNAATLTDGSEAENTKLTAAVRQEWSGENSAPPGWLPKAASSVRTGATLPTFTRKVGFRDSPRGGHSWLTAYSPRAWGEPRPWPEVRFTSGG
jgi:hypothetical protein